MSSYSEHEELEQLKVWWKEYGTSLVVGVLLGIGILVGYRYWIQHQATEREAASAAYDQMLGELHAKKPDARIQGEKLLNEYSSTPYASMAALLLARQAHEAGDKALARQRLEWALAHAKDAATQHAARLRLARLLLDAGEVAAVMPLLDIKDTAGFEAEYLELKGDVALAQGQKGAARSAYSEALKHVSAGSAYTAVITMKLDDLGTEKNP